MKGKLLAVVSVGALMAMVVPGTANAAANGKQTVAQGVGSAVLSNANYFGDTPADTPVTVDIVMKAQNQDQLSRYITATTTPGNPAYRHYLSVQQFKNMYAPSDFTVGAISAYLKLFGISTKVYSDNLIITANGTVGQFNKAFSITIQNANFHGKSFHGTQQNPRVPSNIANSILCILGLSNYSTMSSEAMKSPDSKTTSTPPQGPYAQNPQDLESHYNVTPLLNQGAAGQGQTIGIVTLAGFNPQDAYSFWSQEGINVKPNRINVENVDNADQQDPADYYNGYDETTLDVEQSGSLAPQANIDVYVGPNTDPGFPDAFATAITENKVQSLSASWGESEGIINYAVQQQVETPQYAQVFNQLFMEGAAQGISMFAAAGDEGSYDSARNYSPGFDFQGMFSGDVDNPADSPFITAAGGTTLPWQADLQHKDANGNVVASEQVNVPNERAWSWDYLAPYFSQRYGDSLSTYSIDMVGGGGGFSSLFATPDYQQGVSGVNTYTAWNQWLINSDGTAASVNPTPQLVTGTGSGRNVPDLSMDADPETGYGVYMSDPGAPGQDAGWAQYGGTSFVAPQLAGLTALINSADHTQVGFWNPQIYKFATQNRTPFTPLNARGASNDNDFYTGTPGTLYNQATGLGIPDVTKLAADFAPGNERH